MIASVATDLKVSTLYEIVQNGFSFKIKICLTFGSTLDFLLLSAKIPVASPLFKNYRFNNYKGSLRYGMLVFLVLMLNI